MSVEEIGKAWSDYLVLVGANAHGTEIGRAWNKVVRLLNQASEQSGANRLGDSESEANVPTNPDPQT